VHLQKTTELVESLLLRRVADKELGQHFLIEDSILERTIELAGLGSEDHVLEVGPGPGVLTQRLLATGAKVTAIEIDPIACEHLRDSIQHENLTLIEGDALKAKLPLDLSAVVANIPYQISSPLIEKLSQHQRQYFGLERIVILLQEEFAIRLSMNAGIASRGSLGMTVAMEWTTQMDLKVGPQAFKPQPSIHSRLVKLEPHDPFKEMGAEIPEPDKRLARLIVSTAFEERRKKMRNRLMQAPKRIARVKGWHASGYRDVAKKLIASPQREGLPLGWLDARPEQLDLYFWLALAGWLQELHALKDGKGG